MTLAHNHILLTRFNLPSIGFESLVRAREGWLRDRIELFEEFCLPSVRAQTVEDFSWIIYLDPASPSWLRERMSMHARDGTFVPIYRESVERDELLADIAGVVGTRRAHLITTNLDNDDGLARDFVERVGRVATNGERAAIYLTHGLIKHDSRLYLRVDRHNAFCSVREPWESAVTCWSAWHNALGRAMPVVEEGSAPGWLQVVHGANVSNRVRGRLESPSRHQQRFPGLIAGCAEPSRTEYLREALVERPLRASRESLRATVKWLAVATVGERGIDPLKRAFARATHVVRVALRRPTRTAADTARQKRGRARPDSAARLDRGRP